MKTACPISGFSAIDTLPARGGRRRSQASTQRPALRSLSSPSQCQTIVILNVMFSFLVQASYPAGNLVSLSRQCTRFAAPRITRYLEPSIRQEVKGFIATMP